jgi:hypothetical protein
MSGACGGMYGGEKNAYRIMVGKTTWKTGINGRIVLKWILSGMGNHRLVHLAKDIDK